jgi:hypothetical protein
MKVSNERHAHAHLVDTSTCAANMKARRHGAMRAVPLCHKHHEERVEADRRKRARRIRPTFGQWFFLVAGVVLLAIGVLHLLGLRT